jgi:AcrR family transcriptional regulator
MQHANPPGPDEKAPASPADRDRSPRSGAAESGPDETFARRGYHHGRLREALLHAARSLLAKHGIGAFSLADAARFAGVSPAAPYRHFRDRDALLGALAQEGFATFAARLGVAMRGARDPLEGFLAMGRAYLAFAREEPGLYAAMFSLDAPLDADGARQADAAFRQLIDGVARSLEPLCQAAGGVAIDPRPLACQVWALSHGVASLDRAGRLGGHDGPDAETVLLAGVQALLDGAVVAATRRPRPTGVWNNPTGPT